MSRLSSHATRSTGSISTAPIFSIRTLEATAELDQGWSLRGAYAYNKTEQIAPGGDALNGNELADAPNHLASVWLDRDFTNSLTAGAGLRYIGDRYRDTANTGKLESVTMVDLAVRYDWDNIRASVNVSNLTDEAYLGLAAFPTAPMAKVASCPPRSPRRIIFGAGMISVKGWVQREGEVVHLVAQTITDLSAALGSISSREGPFPLPHGRGDEFHHGSPTPDPRDKSKGLKTRDMYFRDLHLDTIRMKTRDFR